MTPTPQERCIQQHAEAYTSIHGDSVVISGMSGLYPEANSVKELSTILYEKVDPITSSPRWKWNHPEITKYLGKISGLELFDAQFFMVHYRLATVMDPMSRKILEQTYQAIIDAGINPQQLSGKKVAVYVGTSFSETEKLCFYNTASVTGFGIAGCSKTMYANRISYWLNIKGPSLGIDEDSCSGISALEQACASISRGDCEAAIIASASISLHPHYSIHHGRIVKLSPDGKTRSFDANADGFAKSEAINVLFLQKAKDARRIYAYVKHIKCEFIESVHLETGPRFGYYRNPTTVAHFLKTFYEEAGVPTQLVEYVEGVGSANKDADKSELEAFEKTFCLNKKDPLLVGSIMSNIGNTEAASGISSITKILLAYEKEMLSGNLHYTTPREDLRALREGRMRILTENCSFRATYAAVNSMSITGINAHVLLHGYNKPKDLSKYKSNLPRLVNVSGRHEAAVENILNELQSNTIDSEQLALLHNIHSLNITGHLARGFIILGSDENQETVSLCKSVEYYNDVKRPLWFVYSGMGSQWPGMGKELMRIPIFAEAIERCQRILKTKGIDILHILTSNEKTIFDNILHSFVGIAAVQIGLTDVLREIGLIPDKIIGHSVGELGCAYADGCMTLEEVILSAYSRGLVSTEVKLIHGSMAAVALGYREVIKICPPEIEVACHNGPQSSTISGPADIMRDFVATLTAQSIFAKEVPCSNIAYHSRYIADAGPGLLKYLSGVIKSPKLRSERWVSTSVPQVNWNTPAAKYSSAEYHTNNLLNPVLFEETSALIPANAVLVEIAPHGLLQAILKRSLQPTCVNIALTKRHHSDNAYLVLESIGKLYNLGYSTKVDALYPKVEFPVSRGTPMLSHLVEWSHQEHWTLPLFGLASRRTAPCSKFGISITDKEHTFLQGHAMRGNMMYPFASGLVAVWDTLAMLNDTDKNNMSVEFNNVHLHVQPVLHEQRQLRLNVSLHRGTGRFEVTDDFSQVITGFVSREQKRNISEEISFHTSDSKELNADDIYELLQERGYSYHGEFRSIHCANTSFTEADLVWNNNWATLIDGMLQLNALRREYDGVSQPSYISCISIDVNKHQKQLLGGQTLINANVSEISDITRCGGVVMQYVQLHDLPAMWDETDFDLHVTALERNHQIDIDVNNNNNETAIKTLVLKSKHVGDLDSLHWVQISKPIGTGIKVMVHYAGINIGDIMKAAGENHIKQNSEAIGGDYGVDFSGLTKSGDRVMGMVQAGACSNHLLAQSDLLWSVPVHWNLQEAATVPFAYTCAFYCLCIKAEIRPGINILIHGGAGALGQAAIAVSLAHGCQVFTTVSNNEKKQFLLKLYPDLKEEHIGNSRDDSFMAMVLNSTHGNGCDIIICSVKGALKNCSINCCAINGKTLDIANIVNHEHFEFGMYHLNKERSYLALDFMSIFKNIEERKALQMMVSKGISSGYVRPLTYVTYAPSEVSRAFRILAQSQHRGRVLIRLTDTVLETRPSLECSADSCHLIIFSQDIIGLQLAKKLISRGVKKLHMHLLGSSTHVLQHKIRLWRKQNIHVVVSSGGLSDINISSKVSEASLSGPVEGIYVIIGDTSDTNKEILSTLLRELDLSSRQLCPSLKHFAVVVTSNDDLAQNICLERVRQGYPATSINVAVWKTLHSEEDRAVFSVACYQKIIDEIERALLSSQPVLLTDLRKIQRPSLLQQIFNIGGLNIGINIPKDVQGNTTLLELGITRNHYLVIRNLLRDYYNFLPSEEEFALLTIKKINQVENATKQKIFKKVTGLEVFFTYVDPDELLATTELVCLPTIASTELISGEFDMSEQYLCIIPGLEGHHQRFQELCERIKLPAFVIQHDLDKSDESLKETAQRYTNILLKKTNIKNTFYLVGYESGIMVALEMAAILEDLGKTGTVFCIGAAPKELKLLIEEELKEFKTDEQLQNAIARHMLQLMQGDNTNINIEHILRSTLPWSSKIDACVRTLVGRISHSAQYARAFVESAFSRIQDVRCCSVTPVLLRSQIVLLRSSQTRQYDPMDLQAYSQRPVVVHELSSPLAHIVNDVHCATFINQYLHPDILEAFEKSNKCLKYALNGALLAFSN